MNRSQHKCYVPGCETLCQREYPFCASCWRKVPKELRAEVRKAMATRSTDGLDRSALYHAYSAAAASVQEHKPTPRAAYWQRVWTAAGSPELL